jgi:hypothetical protein
LSKSLVALIRDQSEKLDDRFGASAKKVARRHVGNVVGLGLSARFLSSGHLGGHGAGLGADLLLVVGAVLAVRRVRLGLVSMLGNHFDRNFQIKNNLVKFKLACN